MLRIRHSRFPIDIHYDFLLYLCLGCNDFSKPDSYKLIHVLSHFILLGFKFTYLEVKF